MPDTLIREHARNDFQRLERALQDLIGLPEQLAKRREQLFRDAAFHRRIDDLHNGREEYRQWFENYIGVAERYQALAEVADSPLLGQFEQITTELRKQYDQLFDRWKNVDDLCDIILELVQPSKEKLAALVAKHPPPQSWYDETINPFE